LEELLAKEMEMALQYCVACGSDHFGSIDVLWRDLIDAWQLSHEEINYINRQQGIFCQQCGNNLRAMGLAKAILCAHSDHRTLVEFCNSSNELHVLEINKAGNLTQFLQKLPNHKLIEYPQFDMTNLDIESDKFDFVIHSDTLEHVPFPERGLSECRRVLRPGGLCIFTVPIIIGRMSRSRAGLSPSYHGQSGVPADDQLVCTEFGADVWQTVLKAGFRSCEFFSFEYPAALVLIARK
jgi:SAM-dependent methyltransferase